MTEAAKPRRASITFILLFAFLLVLAGLLLDLFWLPSISLSAPLLWINLVPGFWLLGIWFLAKRLSQRRVWIIAPGILLAVLAIGLVGIVNWEAAMLEDMTRPVTNLDQYELILSHKSALTAHFPEHIPSDAVEVHFYYLPAFMQGGSELLLRYRTSSSNLDALLQKHLSAAIEVINGPASKSQSTSFPHALTGWINSVGYDVLPDDFQVLILGTSRPEDWNHGYSYGLAVSHQRQEVLYWAETW